MLAYTDRNTRKRRKRDSLPLRFLLNGRPGSRATVGEADTVESTSQQQRQRDAEEARHPESSNDDEETDNLNTTRNDSDGGLQIDSIADTKISKLLKWTLKNATNKIDFYD